MAAPITHIIFAKQLLGAYPGYFPEKEFIIGTSFPDIRYWGVIERHQTHPVDVSLEEILRTETAFQAGLLFHSFVDETREHFIKTKNIYTITPVSNFITQSLKLVEDEVLFDAVDDWNIIAMHMDTVLPEERAFSIPKKDIVRWHTLLKEYISNEPTKNTRRKLFSALGFDTTAVREIEDIIKSLKENEQVITIIKETHSHFNNLIQASNHK